MLANGNKNMAADRAIVENIIIHFLCFFFSWNQLTQSIFHASAIFYHNLYRTYNKCARISRMIFFACTMFYCFLRLRRHLSLFNVVLTFTVIILSTFKLTCSVLFWAHTLLQHTLLGSFIVLKLPSHISKLIING